MSRRILLLVTDLNIGGTPSVVREMAVRLHRPPAVVVEVACLARWGATAEQIQERGIHVVALGAKGSRDVGVLLRLHSLMRDGGYDTVMSFLIHANAAAAVMKLFHRRTRFIQSIQTTQPEPRWHWVLQGIVQAAAEQIVVPSESVKRAAMEWAHVPAEKIVAIPNAVEPGEFVRSTAGELRPFPIGFIGRLDPIKQVPVLVREFALLIKTQDAVLHIFGDGEDRGRVLAEIDRWGLQNGVVLHGVIAKPQAALAQLGMLVLPSAAEGFGLVLIEAMAAGVPIIANSAPGICDVVRGGQTGVLVDVSRPGQLAEAMQRVIDDPELRSRLIEIGLREVREKYSWDAAMPAYQQVLNLK